MNMKMNMNMIVKMSSMILIVSCLLGVASSYGKCRAVLCWTVSVSLSGIIVEVSISLTVSRLVFLFFLSFLNPFHEFNI